ncbi:hypothetical protein BpHYR1_054480 [Brachionus plicatilis]|uniref:Uncharacterized protein n=1 Tax=Brachionus plicatilis TaxID=10195 RepID=A0A3M7RPS9_BRAPC|nr:hypothetical protein BpHYR1_054480 [Brachionus plicatilis]
MVVLMYSPACVIFFGKVFLRKLKFESIKLRNFNSMFNFNSTLSSIQLSFKKFKYLNFPKKNKTQHLLRERYINATRLPRRGPCCYNL